MNQSVLFTVQNCQCKQRSLFTRKTMVFDIVTWADWKPKIMRMNHECIYMSWRKIHIFFVSTQSIVSRNVSVSYFEQKIDQL